MRHALSLSALCLSSFGRGGAARVGGEVYATSSQCEGMFPSLAQAMKGYTMTSIEASPRAAARASIEDAEIRGAAIRKAAENMQGSGLALLCNILPHLVLMRNPMLGDAMSAKDAAQSVRLTLNLNREEAQKSIYKQAITLAGKIAGKLLDRSRAYYYAADWVETVTIAERDVVRFAGKNRIEDVTLSNLAAIFAPAPSEMTEDERAEARLKRIISAISELNSEADVAAVKAALDSVCLFPEAEDVSEDAAEAARQQVDTERQQRAAKRATRREAARLERAAREAEFRLRASA